MKNRRSNWQIVVSGILIFVVWFGALPVYAQTRQDGKGVGMKIVSELPSKEKRWALIVGIDEYQNDVSTLKGSVNDAKALKNVLVNNAGFPENQIILLTTDSAEQDKRPTRENILGALSELYSRVPEDGLLLFSFSGHGISVGDQAFLIPSNGRFTKNTELLQDFSINVSRIKRAIETMKVKQVLMLLDACRNEPGKGDTPNRLTDTLANGFSFDVANSDVKAFATLYATSIGERAYEFYDKDSKQFRGYFSYAVEEALKGSAANDKGEVTLSRLIEYLETTVPKKVKYDKGETQIPMANYSETYRANQLILAVAKKSNFDVVIQQPKPLPSPIVPTNQSNSIQNTSTVPPKISPNNSNGGDSAITPINLSVRWETLMRKNWRNSSIVVREATEELQRNSQNVQALRMRSWAYVYNLTPGIDHVKLFSEDAQSVLNLLTNPISPEDYEARCHSFSILGSREEKEKYKQGIQDCTKAIKLKPNFVLAYFTRGTIYSRMGKDNLAIKDFTKAIELEPTFALAYLRRADCYYHDNETALKGADLEKAWQLEKEH